MFGILIFIDVHILFYHIAHSQTIGKIPCIDSNDIAKTENIIRDTVNGLFAGFKIPGIKNRTRMKQFSTIHNLFASIMLTDCDTLNKVTRVTTVNNTDNGTIHFITQINEFINDNDKSTTANEDKNNSYVQTYIENFIKKIKHYNESDKSYINTTIRLDILKYLTDDNNILPNSTKDVNVTITNGETQDKVVHDEFWQPDTRRLYKGIRTTIKNFPFIVSVHFFNKFQCAGTIIKNDLVITSVSCLQIAWNNRFFRENPAFLSVRVGCDYYELCGESIPVLETFFHPQYEPNTLKHNLAIMRLSLQLQFGNRNKQIKKINFDRNPTHLPINDIITVVGWGAKDDSNLIHDVYTNKLSYSNLEYFSWEDCQKFYARGFVSKYNFCAGYLTMKGGACSHDAGGPGIHSSVLMGVISFGSPICGAPNIPTVFTKLGFYKDWIEDILKKQSPNEQPGFLKASPKYTTPLELPYSMNTPQKQELQNYMSIILENSQRMQNEKQAVTFLPLDLKTEHRTVTANRAITYYTDAIEYPATKDISKEDTERILEESTDSNGNEQLEMLSTESMKESLKIITIEKVEETNKEVEDTVKNNIITLKRVKSNNSKINLSGNSKQSKTLGSTSNLQNASVLADKVGSTLNVTTFPAKSVRESIKNDVIPTNVGDADKSLEEEIKSFIDNLELDRFLVTNSAMNINDSTKEVILKDTLKKNKNSSHEIARLSLSYYSDETTESSESEEDVGIPLT